LTTFTIRAARLDELDDLNELTGRSSLHWGYEQEFLEWEPEAITLTAGMLEHDPVYVLEVDGAVAGYYQLSGAIANLALDKLFVEPQFIGTGCGKRLWNHAVATARELGASGFSFYSDPNAAGFYRAMGAEWVREEPTSRPGWNLQIFRYTITPEEQG
jgi:GNAT superfamily N-acetyltransferase